MGLEAYSNLDSFVLTNPTDVDDVDEGDDHFRGVKTAVRANITGNATETRLVVSAIPRLTIDDQTVLLSGQHTLDLNRNADDFTALAARNTQGGVSLGVNQGTGDCFLSQRSSLGVLEQTWVYMTRDGPITFFGNTVPKLSTADTGINVFGSLSNNPAAGGDADGSVVLLNQLTAETGRLDHANNTTLRLRNGIWGGVMQLRATNLAGADTVLFEGNPEAGGVVNYQGGERVSSTSKGGKVTNQAGSVRLWLEEPTAGAADITQSSEGVLLTAVGMSTVNQYTPGLIFGSTDIAFTTTNPKRGAAIAGRATESYAADTDGGMGLDFFVMRNNPGATPDPTLGMRLQQSGQLQVMADLIDLVESGTSLAALKARNSEGGFSLESDNDVTTLYQTDTDGLDEKKIIEGVNNARLAMFFNGVEEARTQDSDSDYATAGARVKDHSGSYRDIGFNVMPVIEQDSSTTLDENDVGKILHKDSGGAETYTLPSGTSGAVAPVGGSTMVANEDTEGLTISAAGTLRWFAGADAAPATGNRVLARGSVCTVYHYANTEWWIWGNGLT